MDAKQAVDAINFLMARFNEMAKENDALKLEVENGKLAYSTQYQETESLNRRNANQKTIITDLRDAVKKDEAQIFTQLQWLEKYEDFFKQLRLTVEQMPPQRLQ